MHHVMHMPAWHRYVLLGAIGFAVIGGVGRVKQLIGGTAAPSSVPQAANGGATGTPPQSGFVANDQSAGATTDGNGVADPNAPPWYLSPRFLSVGGSVLGGFIIGWVMRVFVKTSIMIGVLITAAFAALSHFGIMNVDFTAMQQQYSSEVSWLTDQASRLKDVAIAHLPVHAGGLFGVFMGFRRGRV